MENQGLHGNITFSFAASATASSSDITIQVNDNDGDAITEPVLLDVWLSTVTTGVKSTNAPSGNFTVASGGGILMYPLSATTSTHIIVQTTVTGGATLTLTDTDNANTHYYICAKEPYSGRTVISGVMAAADFSSAG